MVPPMEDPNDDVSARVEHIPTNLALVSISRDCFLDHIHSVVGQLLKPSIAFFSITLNEFDVLLVVDEEAGREFRQRSTPKEADQAQNDSAPDNQLRGENTQNEGNDFEFEPPSNGVQVSRIQWTALSLDVSRSPARLCTISEAMKAAGIPIIYQSAMNCDYLFIPTVHVREALVILADEVGFIVSEDERSDRYVNTRWAKSGSRAPNKRSRRPHQVPSNSPSSSSASSSDSLSFNPRGRPRTQKASAPSPMPPIQILPHKIAFHGLNSGQNGDALLKLIKMIGWPHSLLPVNRSKYSPSDLQFGSYDNRTSARSPYQAPPTNNAGPPRRPGFVTRHSADGQTFKSQHGSRLPSTVPHGNAIPIPQAPRQGPATTRSRSTSYPNVLPEFYQKINATNRAPTLPPPVEDSLAGSDTKPSLEPLALSQSQLHAQTLPFFSLTHCSKESEETEVSIMTRGTLLARLFESSMLIGGSGDIAVSDAEDGREEYPRRSRREPTMAGLDEGFRCLQINLDGVKAEQHAKLLSFVVQTLDTHTIRHHLARTIGALDILVPYSQATRAYDILRGIKA